MALPQGLEHWIDTMRARRRCSHGLSVDGLDAAAGTFCLTLFLLDPHLRAQGICSSRPVESFGRPALPFAPTATDDRVLTGSAWSIDGFHRRDALQAVMMPLPG